MKLQVDSITKSFGDKQVLKGISLEVNSGQALGLLGRNGAGKTTAIRIIMDVFGPDSGRVLLDGAPIRRDQVSIGYLPEERGLYPKKLIMEQLIYFGMLRGMGRSAAKDSAAKLLDRLDMGAYAGKKLDTLSKGNQQKIQLIAALITDPEILILDEPFSGLDPVNAMMLKDIVKERIQSGKIVLFSSHQMNYIEEFCEDIAILNSGQIVLAGNIRDIKRRYDRSKLVLNAQQPQPLLDFAQKNPTMVAQVQAQNGQIALQLTDARQKSPFIAALVSHGLDFDGIAVYEPTLGDIFVEYAGDAV